MSWPSLSDYREAIQCPHICFFDQELKNGRVQLDQMGLPKPITGGFASVYKISNGSKKYAARCFLYNNPDQKERYAIISSYISKINLPYMAKFEYIEKGILIRGNWYPLLKMEWIDGEILNKYIEKNLNNSQRLFKLANNLYSMVSCLVSHKIAHGDLQHGNIIIINDELRLVDYDGMYVPGLDSYPANERGQRHYQHPRRDQRHFGPYLDNFSSLVIYISILALAHNPKLWDTFKGGDETILFRKEDFEHRSSSNLIYEIQKINQLKPLADKLISFLYYQDISRIPPLSEILIKHPASITPPPKPPSPDSSWIWDHFFTLKKFEHNFNKERIAFFTFLSALSSNILFYLTVNNYSFSSFLIISSFLAFTFSSFLSLCYMHLPVYKEYKSLKIQLDSIKKTSLELSEKERAIINKINLLNSQKEKELKKISSMIEELNNNYNKEISNLNIDYRKAIEPIKKERDQLQNKINNEINLASQDERKKILNQHLIKHKISSESIMGIGKELVARLSAAGIRTAADIEDIIIRSYYKGGYQHKYATIMRPDKKEIHIEGIGPAKAKALLNWKNFLINKYLPSIPPKLDYSTEMSIRAKYNNLLNQLNTKEYQIKLNYEDKKIEAERIYKIKLKDLNIKEQEIEKTYNVTIEHLTKESRIIKDTKEIKNAKMIRLEKELDSYKTINIRNYFKKIIQYKKQS